MCEIKVRKNTRRAKWVSLLGGAAMAAVLTTGAAAEEMVTIPKSVLDQLLANQQKLMDEVRGLKSQVEDNRENLQRQLGQQQKTDEKLEAVADSVPDFNPVERGKKGATLELSGQLNVGVLYADSGGPAAVDEDREVWIVDNDNSSSRFRFVADAPIDDYWSVGALVELQIEKNSTAKVSQKSDDGFDLTERKIEAIINNKMYGKLRIGQGDTASNGISEQDLSGTAVVGRSAVKDLAGGLIFRDDPTGALSGPTIGDAFSNLDGLSRQERVRYDSPKWHGTSVAASYINGGAYDVRLQHSYKWPVAGGVEVAAAVGYYNGEEIDRAKGVSGSASFLHVPTGLNLTFAAGQAWESDLDPHFYYAKGGWKADIFSLGSTNLAADYFWGSEAEFEDDEADSFGFFVVQDIDKTSTELYFGFRGYMYDQIGDDFQDIYAALTGVRQKF